MRWETKIVLIAVSWWGMSGIIVMMIRICIMRMDSHGCWNTRRRQTSSRACI